MTQNIPAGQAPEGMYHPEIGWTGGELEPVEGETAEMLKQDDSPDTVMDLSDPSDVEIQPAEGDIDLEATVTAELVATPDLAGNADKEEKFKTTPLVTPPNTEELARMSQRAPQQDLNSKEIPKAPPTEEIPAQVPTTQVKKSIVRKTLETIAAGAVIIATGTALSFGLIQYGRSIAPTKEVRVEVPVERIVEKPVDRIIEKPIERIVEKTDPRQLSYSTKIECENTYSQLQEYLKINTEYRKIVGKKNLQEDIYSHAHIAQEIAKDNKLTTEELKQAKKELQKKIDALRKEKGQAYTQLDFKETKTDSAQLEAEIIALMPTPEDKERIQTEMKDLPTGIRMWILYKNSTGGTMSPQQVKQAQEEYINKFK